jgi:hypothetical protein
LEQEHAALLKGQEAEHATALERAKDTSELQSQHAEALKAAEAAGQESYTKLAKELEAVKKEHAAAIEVSAAPTRDRRRSHICPIYWRLIDSPCGPISISLLVAY